jgi:hypothetical protein
MVGASLSRKKRLSAVKERKTASDASRSIPAARPAVKALKPELTEALAFWLASRAVAESTPRSLAQDSIFFAPACSRSLRLSAWLAIPVRTISPTRTPMTMSARKTSAAPAPLGIPRPFNQSTTGKTTDAMIAAVITGITIVSVRARNQTAPTSAAATPTSSQAEKPRSRNQVGAAKMPLSSPGSISTNSSELGPLRPGRRSRPRRIARLRRTDLSALPDQTSSFSSGIRKAWMMW